MAAARAPSAQRRAFLCRPPCSTAWYGAAPISAPSAPSASRSGPGGDSPFPAGCAGSSRGAGCPRRGVRVVSGGVCAAPPPWRGGVGVGGGGRAVRPVRLFWRRCLVVGAGCLGVLCRNGVPAGGRCCWKRPGLVCRCGRGPSSGRRWVGVRGEEVVVRDVGAGRRGFGVGVCSRCVPGVAGCRCRAGWPCVFRPGGCPRVPATAAGLGGVGESAGGGAVWKGARTRGSGGAAAAVFGVCRDGWVQGCFFRSACGAPGNPGISGTGAVPVGVARRICGSARAPAGAAAVQRPGQDPAVPAGPGRGSRAGASRAGETSRGLFPDVGKAFRRVAVGVMVAVVIKGGGPETRLVARS